MIKPIIVETSNSYYGLSKPDEMFMFVKLGAKDPSKQAYLPLAVVVASPFCTLQGEMLFIENIHTSHVVNAGEVAEWLSAC